MERNIQKNGLINLLVMLAFGVAGFAIARFSNSLAGQVATLFLGLGTLVAAVSWFQMRLEDRERVEKLELEELAKGHGGSALFEAREAEIFPAQRSREQFEKFFVPIFTVMLCLLQAGGACLLWLWISRNSLKIELKQATMALAMFAVFFLFQFLLGKFSATMARLENHRLLRPGASYMLLCAYICLAVAAGIVGVQAGFLRSDLYVAYALCAFMALVAVETLVALVLEIYRPRVKGKIERPLYESRLVGLLGQPEGLITTAAQALDYQFGFKVSETWFYRFFERALGWLLLLQGAALFLSTAFIVVEPGQQAVREHLGQVTANSVLGPGPHLVWPWPIDKVQRYRTEQIQNFNVGFTPDPDREKEKTVLWTVPHTKEEINFLVANHDPRALQETNNLTKRTPPVSLVTVSIPVQYQITNLVDWAYNNEDPSTLLQGLSTREVVRYLAAADLNELMSRSRLEAGQELVRRVQAAADDRHLGVRVVSVGMQDVHPPVKVAPDYEKVIAGIQSKQGKILAAQADAIRTNALSRAYATNVLNRAEAERTTRQIGALAEAALFTNQIPAFMTVPEVYAERTRLQTFVRATANARKYILLTTNAHDVITFDLQDKIREDLLNLNPTKK